MLEKINNRKKKIIIGLFASCIITSLIFAIIELRYPFYFTTDDNADWYACEYVHVIRALASGRFPMYSFTQLCGQRLFANGQSGVLNPVMYVAAFLSKLFFGDYHAVIEILAFLMMIIGSIGAYLLLEKLGACQVAAIVGAIAWNFNTYNIWVGNSWILVILVTGVFPYILYGSLRLCDKPDITNYLWAIIPKALLFYIAHPQFFFYAAVFDCLFIGTYTLLTNETNRLKNLLKIIGQYVLIYIAVVVLILPQLLPQYQMIGMTSQKEALSFERFANESDSPLIGLLWPYIFPEKKYKAIGPFIGYPLLVFGILGTFCLPLLLTKKKKSLLKHKPVLFSMIAAIPGIVISFLSSYSTAFKHLLHWLPLVNRFHFLHRNNLFLTSLTIIFSVMSFTLFWRCLCNIRDKKRIISDNLVRIVGVFVILLEAINITFLFALEQQWSRGYVYKVEEGYDEDYASGFSEDRYICCGYRLNKAYDYSRKDLAHNLRFNLASYYGIRNVSGYYGVYTNESIGRNLKFFSNIKWFTGDLWEPYDGFIDEMRGQSVKWYIVYPLAHDFFVPLLEENGMKKVYEDEYGIVYYDDNCEPLAFDEQGLKIELEEGNVNYLKLNTDSDFSGGTITLNYSYDENFHCYVDGKETAIIDDNDNWQMKINCSRGTHEIMICYEDNTFTVSCLITGIAVLVSAVVLTVYKCQNNRKLKKEKYGSEK